MNILRDLRALGCEVRVVARSEASVARAREGGAVAVVPAIGELGAVDGIVTSAPIATHAAVIEDAWQQTSPCSLTTACSMCARGSHHTELRVVTRLMAWHRLRLDVEPFVPRPTVARTFRESRRIRLSEMDDEGRLRLDSVARYLQDVAMDDVDETGWGAPEHLWVLRSIRMEILVPPLVDREVEVTTWCSGSAAVAAGRRMSLLGDRGARVELDSVWIHLGPDARPARIEGFGIYAEAAGDRTVSTRLELPAPPSDARRRPWETRASDIDLFGHVNNAVYWQGVEGRLRAGGIDPHAPLRARLEYRHAIDLGEEVELAEFSADGGRGIAFVSLDVVKAVALVESIR